MNGKSTYKTGSSLTLPGFAIIIGVVSLMMFNGASAIEKLFMVLLPFGLLILFLFCEIEQSFTFDWDQRTICIFKRCVIPPSTTQVYDRAAIVQITWGTDTVSVMLKDDRIDLPMGVRWTKCSTREEFAKEIARIFEVPATKVFFDNSFDGLGGGGG
jgi:hypothetical protein